MLEVVMAYCSVCGFYGYPVTQTLLPSGLKHQWAQTLYNKKHLTNILEQLGHILMGHVLCYNSHIPGRKRGIGTIKWEAFVGGLRVTFNTQKRLASTLTQKHFNFLTNFKIIFSLKSTWLEAVVFLKWFFLNNYTVCFPKALKKLRDSLSVEKVYLFLFC